MLICRSVYGAESLNFLWMSLGFSDETIEGAISSCLDDSEEGEEDGAPPNHHSICIVVVSSLLRISTCTSYISQSRISTCTSYISQHPKILHRSKLATLRCCEGQNPQEQHQERHRRGPGAGQCCGERLHAAAADDAHARPEGGGTGGRAGGRAGSNSLPHWAFEKTRAKGEGKWAPFHVHQ